MKGKALADFVEECLIPLTLDDQMNSKNKENNHLWTININESSNENESRIGVVLESPDGYLAEHSVRFGFNSSNKIAEYEAALVGMDLTKTVKARRIHINYNYRLVVGQSEGEFDGMEESMKKYQEAVRRGMVDFDKVTFQ